MAEKQTGIDDGPPNSIIQRCQYCHRAMRGKNSCPSKGVNCKAEPLEQFASLENPLDTIARLSRELRSATERANDLAHTNARLSSSRLISPEEESAFRDVRRERDQANGEINTIALYFRDHFAREIGDGKHAGKSVSEIVCFYLSEYRRLKRESGE